MGREMSFAGEVVVVTGAASGLGRAIARQFLEAGLAVGVLDRQGSAAAAEELGGRCVGVDADVRQPDSVRAALAAVETSVGPVDILINNAGINGVGAPKPVHETDDAEWDAVLGVNLTGPFVCTRAVLPGMVKRGQGVIVNIASVAALVAIPQRVAYAASKAGVLGLTRTVAVEYGRQGIRTVAICPGWIDTPFTRWRLEDPQLGAAVVASVPMGRVADPAEIAATVLLAASADAAYLTGSPLIIDGGLTAQ
jgi:NAD(P)-dependent dehydrogenase (short-subunit alcohol dehydrogenase family)